MEVCAFCGRTRGQVKKMVKAPNSDVCICDECSRIIFDLTDDGIEKKRKVKRKEGAVKSAKTKKQADSAVTPSQIRTQLDNYVVGQENAKKVLSVALYNHRKRLRDRSGLIKKSNILLVGPSGCGKTLLARTMARLLDVPFATADATSLTAAGYVGGDVESCLQGLLEAAGGDVKLAQKGVVFIDEIDKIACKELEGRDIGGRSVQAALLKMIEGSEVPVPVGVRRNSNVECVVVDTTDILFICGGAFGGIFDGWQEKKPPVGFRVDNIRPEPARENPANTEALVRYGLMPELVGRLPVVCTLDDLTEDDFVRILTEPEDAIIKEYELLLKKDGVKLVVEPDALREIAKTAMEQKTGARGLRGILESLMLDVMFTLPDCTDISKCIVKAETLKTGQPVLVKKRTRKQNAEGYPVTDSPPAARQ